MSLFAGKTTNEPATTPVDWPEARSLILSRLDLVAEYEALGVRFVNRVPDAKGRLRCHAVGRPDDNASAVVFVPSGVYHDSGSGEKAIGFYDFALKHGEFGRFGDVLKHYAGKAGVPIGKLRAHDKGGLREATYVYQDASGEPSYAAFRYKLPNGKKRFTLHAADGEGGWRYGEGNMAGVAFVPYRLPELLASGVDEPVWIVEGEKVVERACEAGLVATTNHMGSGATDLTWPLFLDHFRGRLCYVLPDNGLAGRAHARKVCGYLADVASVVKLVELPGLPPEGDLCDWLDMGHDAAELATLAVSREWSPDDVKVNAHPAEGDGDAELPPDEEVISVRMSDVVRKEVRWLFPDRIPIGKVTLIAGDPGLGKSFLTMDLIARVTTGGPIPAGNGECVPQGPVVLLCAEDDLADTVGPRLDAAGADGDLVHVLQTLVLPGGKREPFNLSCIPHLERMIVRAGGPKLVVIDPVTSYVGGKLDDHKNSALRSVLGPLADMAVRREVAVVIVTHLNKSSGSKALNRITGSLAYVALARVAWLVVRDPEDPEKRLFLSVKNNLAPEPSGLSYRIDRDTRRVVWDDKPVLMTANEALKAHSDQEQANGKGGDREPRVNKADQAREFLLEALAGGKEVSHDELVTMAFARGISKNAIFEAKGPAGVKPRKNGFQGKWFWSIPQPDPAPEEGVPIF